MGTAILTNSSLMHRLTYLLSKVVSSTNGTHPSFKHFKTKVLYLNYVWKQLLTPIKTWFPLGTVTQQMLLRFINLFLLNFLENKFIKKKQRVWLCGRDWCTFKKLLPLFQELHREFFTDNRRFLHEKMREKRWVVPAYTACLPALCDHCALWPASPQLLSLSSLVPV